MPDIAVFDDAQVKIRSVGLNDVGSKLKGDVTEPAVCGQNVAGVGVGSGSSEGNVALEKVSLMGAEFEYEVWMLGGEDDHGGNLQEKKWVGRIRKTAILGHVAPANVDPVAFFELAGDPQGQVSLDGGT